MKEDLWGSLERTAEIGYRFVELAGFYDKTPEEWKAKLDQFGLTVIGSHIPIEDAEERADDLRHQADILGFNRFIVPWAPAQETVAGWIELGGQLSRAGEKIDEQDLELFYHNHSHELVPAGTETGLDLIFKSSSSAFLQAELDLYWLEKAGQNASAWIQKMAGRVPLVHFKDMAGDEEGGHTEIGSGVMDWDDIIDSCRTCGVEYAIVEHDDPTLDPLESIRVSYEFLKSQGLDF